ncbi:hypothetical protein I4U23_011210 [Adineta vaga]|nr:hypothetical protein I4U23_011210 [Adineta vaga]
MIGNSRNARSIYISMVPNMCCQTRFDSTYPNQLNGIIHPQEFEESLKNINKSVISIPLIIICVILPFLCLLGGIALLIVGATSRDPDANKSVLFLAIGGGIAGFGIISLIIGICVMQAVQTCRMRKAVAEESTKYSNRSPVPCVWRLDVTTVTVRGYKGKTSSRRIYTLVITVGSSGESANGNYSNQMSLQPSSTFTQKNQIYPSPTQYGQESTTKFCSQCGMTRPNQMAKFCAQCGQSFNR